jgi:hypothetical protein
MPTARSRSSRAAEPSAGARRGGYVGAIVVGAALLFVPNGGPGWQAMPFLTSDTSQVLGLVNLSLAAGSATHPLTGDQPGRQ